MTRMFFSLMLAAALTGVLGNFLSTASARPYGTTGFECVTDDGNGRYQHCSAGGN